MKNENIAAILLVLFVILMVMSPACRNRELDNYEKLYRNTYIRDDGNLYIKEPPK